MTEDTARLSSACSSCGHPYTYPAHIEEKAVMRCPHCREYIHVRTGIPLGQGNETPAHSSAQPEKQTATLQTSAAPAASTAPPVRNHVDNSSIGNDQPAIPPAGLPAKTPIATILVLAGILLSAAWILISPDDRETYVYDAKDGSFAICWPYIRWGIAVLLGLPCFLAAVIIRATGGAER